VTQRKGLGLTGHDGVVGTVIVVSKDNFTFKLNDLSKTGRKGFSMTSHDGTVETGLEGVSS